jgi:hypothetical protein
MLLLHVNLTYGHLSWFPLGRTEGKTVFQTMLVSGKKATFLVAQNYISVYFVNVSLIT